MYAPRIALATAVLGGLALAPAEATAEITAAQVHEAIDRGVDWLKNEQQADGSWPDTVGHSGGVTALSTLALLEAGVPPDDPHMARALNWLRALQPTGTYVLALQTMVFAKAEPNRDLPLIARNVARLEAIQVPGGERRGSWTYGQPGTFAHGAATIGDNSNAQFALLALHEAERAGVPVSDSTWQMALDYWEAAQNPDGSWGYHPRSPGTGSMTAAGIACLVIASDMTHSGDARVEGGKIVCCQNDGENGQRRLERGLRWMGENFSASANPGPGARGQRWFYYYLYGIERVGRLTNRRFLGEHDWYRAGADRLVSRELGHADFWRGIEIENNERIATSLALLFLAKGRRPILLSKLRYGEGNEWNLHRGDVANLTGYVESRWERDLSWQVVDLAAASVEDLVQSPVLYLSGREDPFPADPARRAAAEKLRDYMDRGGFVLAEAVCGGEAFDRGFRELVELAFPEPEYQLRLLGPEHPIWRTEERIDPDQVRPLLGLDFGCRTSLVHLPPDPPRHALSCLWEVSRTGRGITLPAAVQSEVDAGLSIGMNILAYATNREVKYKYEHFAPPESDRPRDALDRGRLYLASIRHPGGCNAAPLALRNFLEAAADQLQLRVGTEAREVDLTDPELFAYHMVFMHGRHTFRLTDTERKNLRTFVERGGMVFANSICTSKAFTESFRREMAEIFPDRSSEPIAAGDPLYSPDYGGFDLSTVSRRELETNAGDGPIATTIRKGPPVLEGIRIDNRWGVVFSQYDISCALEQHAMLECPGYPRDDAARISLNVLLYSLQQ